MHFDSDEAFIKREKLIARDLRKSNWWHNKINHQCVCYYCQIPLDKNTATMDHVVPLAQGGRSTKGNIVAACRPCNMTKRDRSASEWIMALANEEVKN